MSWRGHRCSECGQMFVPRTQNQVTCSAGCNVARASRQHRRRDLDGRKWQPHKATHPFLVAADQWEAWVCEAPACEAGLISDISRERSTGAGLGAARLR
jgi:hypothetical protein